MSKSNANSNSHSPTPARSPSGPEKNNEKNIEKKGERKSEKKIANKIEKHVEVKQASKPKAPSVANPKPLMRLNIILIFLIIVILGGVLGFSCSQLKTMSTSINAMTVRYEASQRNYLAAETQLDNVKKDLANQKTLLRSQQKNLDKFTSTKKHQQWQLQEITYLINLANYAITFSQDPSTAYELLNTANKTVIELNDPSAVALRQAIETDLDKLKSVKKQDITGLFITLDTLASAVSKAPLIGESPVLESQVGVEKSSDLDTNIKSNWKTHLQHSWVQLKSLIVVRDQSDGLKPLVARQGGDYIFQYITLELGQAQWALLHRNNNVYQASLKQAEHWVSRYFVAGDPATQKALALFKTLQEQDVNLKQVSLNETLKAIAAFNQ